MEKSLIIDADDLSNKHFKNCMKWLDVMVCRYPKFKITLFTIPYKILYNELQMILNEFGSHVELAIHGFSHSTDDFHITNTLDLTLKTIYNTDCYVAGFKYPYWKSNEYMDKVLTKMNFWLAVNKNYKGQVTRLYSLNSQDSLNYGIHGHVGLYDGGLSNITKKVAHNYKDHNFKFISERIKELYA